MKICRRVAADVFLQGYTGAAHGSIKDNSRYSSRFSISKKRTELGDISAGPKIRIEIMKGLSLGGGKGKL
jgi:hypothetical protein